MICVSLGNLSASDVKKAIGNFNLLEIRFDLIDIVEADFLEFMKNADKLIATGRIGSKLDPNIVNYIEKSIDSGVKYVDIDYNERGYYPKALSLLKSSSTKLILSYHNYNETPDIEDINSMISEMQLLEPDIIKLCFKANEIDDIVRTMFLYIMHPEIDLVAFNLGKKGCLSRLLALKAGAPLMYAALDSEHKIEKSQLTYYELNSLLKIINDE